MKPIRLTATHQNITFSRRMLLLGGAQFGVGALLIGRMVGGEVVRRSDDVRHHRVAIDGHVIDVTGVDDPVAVHVVIHLLKLGEGHILLEMILIAAVDRPLVIRLQPCG